MVNWNTTRYFLSRIIHPDPVKTPGRTWSPRFTQTKQDRIDYIYYTPELLQCTQAAMVDQWVPRWPSDHAAVLATFIIKNKAANK